MIHLLQRVGAALPCALASARPPCVAVAAPCHGVGERCNLLRVGGVQ